MTKRTVFTGLVLGLLAVSTLDGSAREVTVYRLQVGAYPTLAEAQEKSADVQSATPALSPVLIREATGTHPFKVWVGSLPTYQDAKDFEAVYEASELGNAYVVSENMEEEDAEEEGLAIPTTLHDQLVEEPRDCDNMAEEELIYNADMSLLLARQCSGRIDCASYMQVAVPYLLELAEDHPESASSDWAHENLADYYYLKFLIDRDEFYEASPWRGSATEEAALDAALEQYKIVSELYPESVYAVTAAYQAAKMKNERRRVGVYGQSLLEALEELHEFREAYPEHPLADKALYDIGEMDFLQAKRGRITPQQAYGVLEQVLSVTESLTQLEADKTRVMMAELQKFYMEGHQAALDILAPVDFGPSQDRHIGANGVYIQAQAYYVLGNYEAAIDRFQLLLDEYDNKDFTEEVDLHPLCLYEMGECQMKMGLWDDAEATFQLLKQQWPNEMRAGSYDGMLEWIAVEKSKEGGE